MNQLGFPSEVTPQEIAREKSLGDAIALCIKAAGLEPKQAMALISGADGKPVDKGQWSRWESGQEGIVWPKFVSLIDKEELRVDGDRKDPSTGKPQELLALPIKQLSLLKDETRTAATDAGF